MLGRVGRGWRMMGGWEDVVGRVGYPEGCITALAQLVGYVQALTTQP